jgi:CelD/BcsL family acetyltransferase involved in cellulose biosynthesis
MSNATVFSAFNGSSQYFSGFSPNDLLNFEGISAAHAEGYRCFDLGTAQTGSGLERYKQKWGGEPVPLHRYVCEPARGRALTRASRSRRLPRAVRRGWRHVPLRATELLGDIAYRFA